MFTEARKLHLIDEVLKTSNEETLLALESLLKKPKKIKTKKVSIYDFVGVLSSKEAAQIEKTIAETSETIYENDWK